MALDFRCNDSLVRHQNNAAKPDFNNKASESMSDTKQESFNIQQYFSKSQSIAYTQYTVYEIEINMEK